MKIVKLGDVCDFKARANNELLPYIGMKDVESNTGKFLGSMKPRAVKSSTSYFDETCVLYGKLRPYLNKVFVPDFEGHCSTEFLAIRPDLNKLDRKYLWHFLISPKTVDTLNSYTTGTRMPRADISFLKSLEIALPPLKEQKRVVERLDAAFEKIDRAIDLTEKNTSYAEALYVSVRNVAIQELAGDESKFINDIGINLDSKRIPITKSTRKSGEYPYYGASGIVDYVNDYIFDQEALLVSEDGANLLARSTPIAFTASGKFWVNNHAHIYIFPSQITQKYVEYYLENTDLKPFVTGAAQPKLSQGNLNKIPIYIPTLDTQEKIVDTVSQARKVSEALRNIYENKLNNLKALKQSLLTQAFTQSEVE